MTDSVNLQELRKTYKLQIPRIFQNVENLGIRKKDAPLNASKHAIDPIFPQTCKLPEIYFEPGQSTTHKPLKVGVVLSGGQAAGGHNVIIGIFNALKKLNKKSQLFGFLNGPGGIIKNKYKELSETSLNNYRNQGGFDLIGSGRTKIETPEQFQSAEQTVKALMLDGLVIIGGDDSNTNAALLAEYFLSRGISTKVIGVPKTIDGDLKNEHVEISFGFDTATKTFSETIGNILRDALSQKKYYFFIKLMGRSASHIALECALRTHPNVTLIGEEVESEHLTFQQITNQICDVICQRAEKGKNYGVILIPEGIIEFIPEIKKLIKEINAFPPNEIDAMNTLTVLEQLSEEGQKCFNSIPKTIQLQMILDRDPHGNVRVSQIETERLFIEAVQSELKTRASSGAYTGQFSAQPHFCGYEGRSCLPTNFDSQYCYALGFTAALLVDAGATGCMACIKNLTRPVAEWQASGVPFISMLHLEERQGKAKPVIKKTLVDLKGKPFKLFQEQRNSWFINDDYQYPGPIQFFGPQELTDSVTITLELESNA